MKRMTFVVALLALAAGPAFALDGQVGSHDPSTVIECDGKYYLYSTGPGIPSLVSDDGWTWQRGPSVMANLPGGRAGAEVVAHAGGNQGSSAGRPMC